MEDALRNGEAQMIGIARPVCGEPDCVKQLIQGKIEKLPSTENELTLPWYLYWTQYIIIGKFLKVASYQMWSLDMIIQMGNGKKPTNVISINHILGNVNAYDAAQAAKLKGLDSISGESLNPSFQTKYRSKLKFIAIILVILAIIIPLVILFG